MLKVAVMFGGPSLEHEISLLSGGQVLEAMDRDRYVPLPVRIERDGRWIVQGRACAGALEGARALQEEEAALCFLALHGPFGEDGTIQGFLDAIGMPYTGSGLAASALARDKIRAKRFAEAHGVPGAPDLVVPPATEEEVRRRLGYPVVVKDPFQGSTLGLRLARDAREYADAVRELSRGCERLLVERREVGREVTAPILDDERGRPHSLPLVEIRTPQGWFDYHAKYTEGAAEEIVPAPVDETLASEVRRRALAAHRAFGLRGMSRSDFILRPDDGIVFLETNTIPGLTPHSLLPKSAAAAGISFTALVTRLIEGAIAGPRAPQAP